jgi:cytochrome P450
MLDAAHPLLEYVPQFQARWFPPWHRFQRAKRDFVNFCTRYLADRRANGDGAEDVLGMLIDASYEDGTAKSDGEILDELYTILLPGHATTGVALAWALYELGRHPSVLARLREELDSLGPDPDPAQLARQPYLGAVCSETMRLHTIVTETARLTHSPRTLLGYKIPAGIGLGISMSAIHQDPSLYPEPDRFRPERFINQSYGPHEYLPFGGSHRRCLGAALSDYEMRLALATIVTRWEFENIGEEREVRQNLGMGPKYGVRLRLGRRRNRAV